jgi:hypothetical protein
MHQDGHDEENHRANIDEKKEFPSSLGFDAICESCSDPASISPLRNV